MNIIIVLDSGERVRYENFLSATVSAKMGQLTRTFEFTAATRGVEDIPFRAGHRIEIWDEDDKLLTGYIEKLSVGTANKGHSYRISGRDLMADVIDSNLPRMTDLQMPLPDICRRVIAFLGIQGAKVIDLAGTQSRPFKNIFAPDGDDSAGDFLAAAARRKRVLLQSDADGNMVITEGIGLKTKNQLINRKSGSGNNMLAATFNIDHTQRFGRYITTLQILMASSEAKKTNAAPEQLVNQRFTAEDPDIRKSRFKTTARDVNLGKDETNQRPAWERGMRIARAIRYNVTVPGFRNWEGDLWELNTAPTVIDEFAGINGRMLISEIEYAIGPDGGTTKMVLTDTTAFSTELKIRKVYELDGPDSIEDADLL